MHFAKLLGSILLAATASASPLGSHDIALRKRESSDGQAGAYINAGDNVAIAFVYGSVEMPDLSDAAKNTMVSYWIGLDCLDTDRCIQAGLDATKGSHGKVTYDAWYEWFPEGQKLISASDFTANVGDDVSITVTVAQYGTVAVAAFVNKNTLKSYNTPEFYTPGEEYDATGINAAWVVERPPGETLADFGEVIFTECSAADKGGYQYYLTGGTTLDLVADGKTLATGSIVGDGEVDIECVAAE